jgi:hypothetical protein
MNYGCGYCKYRDSVLNWCLKHNQAIPFDCKVSNPTCDDYEHSEDLPDFYCAIDEQDLTHKDATKCRDY